MIISAETRKDIIPRNFDARTKVYEYGGAAAVVNDGVCYFSNMGDNRVYMTSAEEALKKMDPVPVTPSKYVSENRIRFLLIIVMQNPM